MSFVAPPFRLRVGLDILLGCVFPNCFRFQLRNVLRDPPLPPAQDALEVERAQALPTVMQALSTILHAHRCARVLLCASLLLLCASFISSASVFLVSYISSFFPSLLCLSSPRPSFLSSLFSYSSLSSPHPPLLTFALLYLSSLPFFSLFLSQIPGGRVKPVATAGH